MVIRRNSWKVESFTEKGKFYTVEKFGEEWICDCPSFEHRHIECKHIKKVKEDIDLEFGSKSEGKEEMKAKEYIRVNIKKMIENSYQSIGYMRGYIAACGEFNLIGNETQKEFQEYLRENVDKIMARRNTKNIIDEVKEERE
jgi:hypothetical protein